LHRNGEESPSPQRDCVEITSKGGEGDLEIKVKYSELKTNHGVTMEKGLERLAEQILAFDEASLTRLREKYRLRIEQFDGTKDWERAVIIYSIINAVSLKNNLFNENVLRRKKGMEKSVSKRPGLKRVK
jgi:hypothetical protein